jgi:hypothetical protein
MTLYQHHETYSPALIARIPDGVTTTASESQPELLTR